MSCKITLYDVKGGHVFCDFFSLVMVNNGEISEGNEVEIHFKKTKIGEGVVVGCNYFNAGRTNTFVCALEGGNQSVKTLIKKVSAHYGNVEPTTNMVQMVIKYNKKNFEAMNILIEDWWKSQTFSNQ